MAAPTNPKVDQAPLDVIPMKKSNPMLMVGIIGGVLLVGGAVAFSSMKSKPKKDANAVAASAEADPFAGMSAEDRKRHIEITRKSLASVAAQEAEEAAKKKAAEAAKAAEEAAKPSGGPAPAAGGGEPTTVAAKAPAGDDPPKKKAPTTVEKKKMDDLDKLGSDISGKLGK
ncbi:MAG: hypothetical protein IPI67_27630 [Myxococcales bacterium]|nr:hypothetical protein [Myxococcales bacterium]